MSKKLENINLGIKFCIEQFQFMLWQQGQKK